MHQLHWEHLEPFIQWAVAVVLHSGPRHEPTSMSLGRALRRKEIDASYIGQSLVYGATLSTFGLGYFKNSLQVLCYSPQHGTCISEVSLKLWNIGLQLGILRTKTVPTKNNFLGKCNRCRRKVFNGSSIFKKMPTCYNVHKYCNTSSRCI